MTAGEIRARAIARRTAMGLKIRVLLPEGPTTLYPKDQATKQAWLAAARRQGHTILES